MNVAVVIPAYNPPDVLVDLVADLATRDFRTVIVVDDGSNSQRAGVFSSLEAVNNVVVLRHGVNRGKGAALKTGLEYAHRNCANLTGVVTADADGQHLVKDIVKVADVLEEHPDSLVLGVRDFAGYVPWRSVFGNILTRYLFRALHGKWISDTQTGLRGIPARMIPSLPAMKGSGYEFELEMLVGAVRNGDPIVEERIETVYLDENVTSHFHPVLDSMKIYFTLFRFAIASLCSAIVDYILFGMAFALLGQTVLVSQIVGRCASVMVNYLMVKNAVFYSRQRHAQAFPKFVSLVVISGGASYCLIIWLASSFGMSVILAKLIVESTMFFVNFIVQRYLIFTH